MSPQQLMVQFQYPSMYNLFLDTGFVDEKGDWKGSKSSDKDFIAFQLDSSIANGGEFITPSVNADGSWPIDMTGYKDIMIAIKPTSGGAYSLLSIMGPSDVNFAN